ncbi:DUF2461 domain-containing protein [Cryomorpha ignava]|uniref:DUF2461 domain-containing protein n=1 Tax=Cryomorpha ignava TaxID=101383 RepID=A0A7K3WVW5_9FLAO|nr:DUF2461 domain-containing protein [Cryomorpha ignava]NEN25817.1 DUF2461 domain-containing protein [Cryomorpha ignava]
MAYFKSDFNTFFKELAANNNKDWFDENRERYHQNIKKPFEDFVAALMAELQKEDPALTGDPKKAIFRINRDIRFAKDKAPYKLNRAAAISPYGRKDGARPGLYIQLGPENVRIAGGVYSPNKEELMAVREAIMNNPREFEKAINDENFLETFGEIEGEENKRLPTKELMEAAKKQPMLLKKQFFYSAVFPPEIVTDDLLIDLIVEKHRDAKPVRDFFEKALNG